MGLLWSLLVGALIGFVAGNITGKGDSMGAVYNIAAGLIGSSIGQSLFGNWGPKLAGMALVPSILGAIVLIAVVSFFTQKKR